MADLLLNSSSATVASMSLSLTNGTKLLASVATAVAAMTLGGTASIAHMLGSQATAIASLSVSLTNGTKLLSAVSSAQASGTVGANVWKSFRAISPATGTLNASITSHWALRSVSSTAATGTLSVYVDSQGLTVGEVVKHAVTLLGSCCIDTDECLQGALLYHLNASLQLIWSRAHQLDYFNRLPIAFTLAAGTEKLTLGQGVQNILGPVKLTASRIPLREVMSRSEFDRFIEIYYGDNVPNEPRAYFVESSNQAGGDNVSITLHVVPVPDAETSITVDASIEPPRYVWSDVTKGTPIQMPHRFAEILLIPLVRHWATGHQNFTRVELLPQIEAQYKTAMETLGLVHPNTNTRGSETQPKEEAS